MNEVLEHHRESIKALVRLQLEASDASASTSDLREQVALIVCRVGDIARLAKDETVADSNSPRLPGFTRLEEAFADLFLATLVAAAKTNNTIISTAFVKHKLNLTTPSNEVKTD